MSPSSAGPSEEDEPPLLPPALPAGVRDGPGVRDVEDRERRMRALRRLLALGAAVGLAIGTIASASGRDGADTRADGARVVERTALVGCDRVPDRQGPDRTHLDAATAPPPSELYRHLPPTSGRHYAQVHPLVVDADLVADVRATTHNLEHGAVIVHVDAARLGPRSTADLEQWADELTDAGFVSRGASAGIIVVAMPVETTDQPVVALRAWGVGLDCDRWDRATADAFVVQHYGDRGSAPEGGLAPYPEGNELLLEGSFV